MMIINQYKRELLEVLFQEEIYPWNPAELEAEDYLSAKEEEISFSDSLDSEELRKNLWESYGISG